MAKEQPKDQGPQRIGDILDRLGPSLLPPESAIPKEALYDCELCQDVGWIETPPLSRQWRQCLCRLPKRVRHLLPAKFHTATLNDFPSEFIDKIKAWLAKPGDGLFLTGPTGSGKSHLAAAIIRELVFAKREVRFLELAVFFRRFREATLESPKLENLFLEDLFALPWLALDDIGAGGLSDYENRTLLDLIDSRMNKLHPTIATSNWSLQDIAHRMDDRIASRLGAFVRFEFPAGDRRVSG